MDEIREKDTRTSNRLEVDGIDLLPGQGFYRNEGCELADSCLLCPFPSCVREETIGRRRWLKKRRAREIARLFTDNGKNVKELAAIFKVSQRTVYRVLKSKKESKNLVSHRRIPGNCSAVDFVKQPHLK
jgi:hypothetical protein